MVLAIALIASVIMGVAFLVAPAEGPKPQPILNPNDLNRPLVRVEKHDITEFHLKLMQYLQALRGGYQKPDFSLMLDLIDRACGEEILRRYGRGIEPKDVEETRARFVRETKDAETLRKIVDLLDRYPGMFELIYVRPVIVNQRMHHLHGTNRDIQRAAYAKAEEVLKEALRDPDYLRREFGAMPDLYHRIDTRTTGRAEDPPDVRKQQQEMFRKQAEQFLGRVRPGDVCPEVVDHGGGYSIMRLIERDGEDWLWEQATVLKSSYESWLESELPNLKVQVLDKKIEDELRANLKDHYVGRWLFGRS